MTLYYVQDNFYGISLEFHNPLNTTNRKWEKEGTRNGTDGTWGADTLN